jgi:hypothetical protein
MVCTGKRGIGGCDLLQVLCAHERVAAESVGAVVSTANKSATPSAHPLIAIHIAPEKVGCGRPFKIAPNLLRDFEAEASSRGEPSR